MVPGEISLRVLADRLAWIDKMLAEVRMLPLQDQVSFFSDTRNYYTAESCIRQALEALFDIGRHILAKAFGQGVGEYKQIAIRLGEEQVIPKQDVQVLIQMAGFRNRMVHFYHEVDQEELFVLCRDHLVDIEKVADELRTWVRDHTE